MHLYMRKQQLIDSGKVPRIMAVIMPSWLPRGDVSPSWRTSFRCGAPRWRYEVVAVTAAEGLPVLSVVT